MCLVDGVCIVSLGYWLLPAGSYDMIRGWNNAVVVLTIGWQGKMMSVLL